MGDQSSLRLLGPALLAAASAAAAAAEPAGKTGGGGVQYICANYGGNAPVATTDRKYEALKARHRRSLATSGSLTNPPANDPRVERGMPVAPVYPVSRLSDPDGGKVLLVIRVSATGEVLEILAACSDHKAYSRSAIKAIKQARFNPAIIGGEPKPSIVLFPVSFKP